jgi:hypothetical protein
MAEHLPPSEYRRHYETFTRKHQMLRKKTLLSQTPGVTAIKAIPLPGNQWQLSWAEKIPNPLPNKGMGA